MPAETPDQHKARTGKCPPGFHADDTDRCQPVGQSPSASKASPVPGYETPEKYADSEWEEYADNDFTRTMFPDAFGGKDEFVKAVASAPTVGKTNWSKLHGWGGSVANVKKGDLKAVRDEVWGYNKDRWLSKNKSPKAARKQYDAYFDKMVGAAQKGQVPPTLVGVHKGKSGKTTEYVLGGNTRAMIHTALGIPTPVKKIPLKGRMREPREDGSFPEESLRRWGLSTLVEVLRRTMQKE